MFQRAHTTDERIEALRHRVRQGFVVFALLWAGCLLAQPLHVIWDRSGAGDSSRYGYTILPLGDQNNDGYADWAVFAEGGVGDLPLLEFFHGGYPMPTQPYMTQHLVPGDVEGAVRYIDVLGDVNRDGYRDWYIGTLGPIQQHTPMVISIYYGGPNADTLADLRFMTDGWDEVLPIGDFNGDGYDDLYWYHFWQDYGQAIYGGNPMDTIPDWTLHSHAAQQSLPQACGDLNGDGYSDWIGEDGSTHTAYIFLGGTQPDTVPAYTWPHLSGYVLAVVKDLNGDSYDELLLYNGEIHFGGPVLHSLADLTLDFPCGLGHVAASGDFNHDGFGDLVLVNENCIPAPWGVLSLYLGHPWINPQPAFSIYGLTPPLNLHSVWTAAGLGDVNGDHIDDLAIGALDDIDYAGWRGRVVILAGDSTLRAGVGESHTVVPQQLQVSIYPNPFNATTTIELDVPTSSRQSQLAIYNLLGQQVFSATLPPAVGTIRYPYDGRTTNGTALTTGVYLARVICGALQTTTKLMVLR